MNKSARVGHAAWVLAATLPLAACGGSSGSQAAPSVSTVAARTTSTSTSAPTTPSSTVTTQAAPAPQTVTDTVTASPAQPANPNIPSNAAPGAGGQRPANATPLTEHYVDQYSTQLAFKTQSGHNGCQVSDDGYVRCGSEQAGQLFMDPDGQIDNGAPPADDAPIWPMSQTPVLPYGQVRYLGNTVFAATNQGVTVWNTQTGHGALINTGGVHQF